MLKKNTLIFLLLLAVLQQTSFATTYNWNTWVAGALTYNTTNMSAVVTNTAFDTRGPQDPNGGANNGYKSPKYVSNATINTYQGGFTNDYGMQGLVLGVDWANLTSSTTVTITFTTPVAGPVSFSIYDINTGSWGGNNPVWIDKITIAGTNCSGAAVYPTITGCGNNVSGANNNIITGNLGCTNNTNTITFNSPTIKTITITYASGSPLSSGYGNDPDPEYIIISEITASNSSLVAAGNNASITCTSSTVALNGSSSVANAAYSWTGPNSSSPAGTTPNNASTTVSSAGDYVLAVTDPVSGCIFKDTVTVNQNGTPPGASIATPAQLGCSISSVTLTASSPASGVTYSWSGGGTGATKTVTLTGTYTVTVTDPGNGCTSTASTTVTSTGNTLSITTNSTGATCGNNNGSATVNLTAGTATGYSWSNGGNTAAISNVAGGTYTVTVTGTGGCSATASVTVTSTSGITLATSSTSATCGNANGSATVNLTAGTATGYSWSNGGNTAAISNVAGGTYTVTVTGTGGCSATASVTVASTSGITLTTSSTNATCGNSNGSATVSLTAGTATGYTWSNGGNTSAISNVAGGTYTVTVTGTVGCSATASVTITSSSGLTLSSSAVNTSCGNNNGSAKVSVTAGNAPFTYVWSNGGNTDSIFNLLSGIYTVTVTGAGGCTATASATVGSSGNTPVTISSNQTVMCSGDSAQICAPSGYTSYLWNTGATSQCIYTKLAGNYYVTVTDIGNCTATSNHLAINVHPQPPVSISVNGDTLLSYNAVTYQWYLDGVIIPGAVSPLLIATQSGYYTVLISDANGCTALSLPVQIIRTGVEEIVNANLNVYPNPLQNGNWNLECGTDLIGSKMEIYDNNGRLVYKFEIRNTNFEVPLNVSKGIYLMKIISEQKSLSVKLLKL